MKDAHVIDQLQKLKSDRRYTLHDLSKKLDIQVTTIERWFKTKRINRMYASFIKEKMKNL